jgi:peptidoglycan/LPS O-acetylase OafA/YrhL
MNSGGQLAIETKFRGDSYNPVIDGLRGFAVLAVLVYHLNPRILPAGFLGVDIFFVISGYLIGGWVIEKIGAGNFSFSAFFRRRVRRLGPALLLVLLVTQVFSSLFFPPAVAKTTSEYALFATFGLSNFRFIRDDPYDAVDAVSNALLHTWSLGVEEQFYLILPAIVLAATRLLGSPRFLIPILLGLASLSFLAAILDPLTTSDQVRFFSFHTRAWELIAGVILSQLGRPRFRTAFTFGGLLGIAAVVFLIASLFLFEPLEKGPGIWTVPVVFATATVIFFSGSTVLKTVLGNRAIARLGIFSYPLYLWHFPILAIFDYLFPAGGLTSFFGAALSILLGFLTWRFVEVPIRLGTLGFDWSRFTLVLGMLVLLVASSTYFSAGFPQRLLAMPNVEDQRLEDGPKSYGLVGGKRVFIVGDSHMGAIGPSVTALAESQGWEVFSWTQRGCQFLLGVNAINVGSRQVIEDCTAEIQQQRLSWIESNGPGVVILAGRLTAFLEREMFDNSEGGVEQPRSRTFLRPAATDFSRTASDTAISEALMETIAELTRLGNQVVIVYPIPEVGWNVPNVLTKRVLLNGFRWPVEPLTTSAAVYESRNSAAIELLDSIKNRQVSRVRPYEIFCSGDIEGRCITHSDTEIFYRDDDHLSKAGADLLAQALVAAVDKIELRSR